MRHLLNVRLSIVVWILIAAFAWAQDKPAGGDIDWNHARQLLQKENRGEKLTVEEQAYLDRAKAERAKRNPTGGPAVSVPPAREKTGLVPLDQMSATDKYKGEDGGLYGGGKNAPPEAHAKAAAAAATRIAPLDADGKPSPDGKIVLLSVGMSNTSGEFSRFVGTAMRDAERKARLVVVDGAQGGQTAPVWAKAESKVWQVVEQRLGNAGVTAKQVQAIWLKQAIAGPAQLGEFPAHARKLKDDLVGDVRQILQHYPNVRLIFLSSRIYAGYATTPLNPEPFAYESAFAVRWVIADQIKGDPALNHDLAKGEVKAPVLLWGPYLWADGTTPRRSDGLTYAKEDLGGDGTHPGPSGQAKVVKLLMDFFRTDPAAKGWFLKEKP
jgi:hypothetical protein